MSRKLLNVSYCACSAMLLILGVGCNSPAGIAVQLVGKAVDDIDTKNLGDELVGKRASAADQKFGPKMDTWRQVNGPREWRVYPVSLDVVGNQRYVVQVARDNIIAITKVKVDGSGIELARSLMYDQKVQGKSPQDCEAALGMGPPLVTARSEKTGLMCQLYDAKMIQGVGSPQYCRLHFDTNQRCDEVALVDVGASTKDNPTQ